jgi:hypothetical protein
VNGNLGLGLGCALASALALNWGYWAQHGAASGLPPLSLRRPLRSLLVLASHRRWLVGFFVGIGGWVLYVAALRVAPLSLVQAVSAGGIGVLALLAWKLGRAAPARREVAALVLALAGLAGLAVSVSGASAHSTRGSIGPVLAWVAGSGLIAAASLGVGAARLLRAGAGFGVAAGILYAAGDVATKAAVGGGARIALVAVLLACHGLAFVALQLGFQRGGVMATAGLASLFTNAVPIVAGMVLFGEGLPAGWAGVVRAISFAAVVVGGAGLARGEAGHDAVPEPVPDLPALPGAPAIPLT